MSRQSEPLAAVIPLEISLEAFRQGTFYTLKEAAFQLHRADRRSVRRWIRQYGIQTYRCPSVNGSAVYIHLDGLQMLASRKSRPFQPTTFPGDEDLNASHAREIAAYKQLLQQMIAFHAQERAEYEQRIAELQMALNRVRDTLPEQETPVPEEQISRAVVSSLSKGTLQRLPKGYVTLDAFAQKHGISLDLLETAIRGEEIPIVNGNWRYGKIPVSRALDAVGQGAFHRYFLGSQVCQRCLLDTYGYIPASEPSSNPL